MALTSSIVPYDSSWSSAYQAESVRLRPVFERNLLEICHIGSTAIRGLAAKPEIDILVVVEQDVDHSAGLQALNYRRGGDLSPGHHFFKKDINGKRTHKVHVCVDGHAKIEEMKLFMRYLQRNPQSRNAYAALKLSLEASNTKGIAEYLDGKAPFIQQIVAFARAAEKTPCRTDSL